ncbi:MAG: hypothetical protein ACYCTI_12640 [Acidimicrobiales bacterium]
MTRLEIEVDEGVAERVREVAEARATTPEALVREVITDAFPARRRRLGFIGLGHSGRSDTAARSEEVLGRLAEERFARKMGRTVEGMRVNLDLPEALAERLRAAALTKGVNVEEYAAGALEAQLPAVPPSFIGIASSGTSESVADQHKEYRRRRSAGKTAEDA